jgi:HEAT repeat protein
MGRLALLLAALAGCSAVETDIRQAELKMSVSDFFTGGRKSLWKNRSRIQESVTKPQGGGWYQYVGPHHVTSYTVERSLRNLGKSTLEDGEQLAIAVDEVLHVVSHDPVPRVRALAAEQLGVLFARRALPPESPADPDPKAGPRINQIAIDLQQLGARVARGEQPEASKFVERIEALAAEKPPEILLARQAVRALASRPVAGAAGSVKLALERVAPGIVRDAILVALRDLACGNPYAGKQAPDPSPLVRRAAAKALERIGSPVARFAALMRLSDLLDPAEGNVDVRAGLLDYLAVTKGPDAFEAALRRLEDVDALVRLHALAALRRMTGERFGPEQEEWIRFRESRPEWKLVAAEEGPAGPG